MSDTQVAPALRPLLPVLPIFIYVCAVLGAAFAVFSRLLPPNAQFAGLLVAWMLIALATAAGIGCIVMNAVFARSRLRDIEAAG